MITIDFYSTFEKKTNSTKKPSGTASLSIQGNMIMPSSILHPVFQIKRLAADACPEGYVYAVIPAFERYYFVRDWVWVDGLWEVRLDCDVLASWKSYIGELNEYILRTDSTSTDFNGDITDITYPSTTDIISTAFQNASPFTPDSISSGSYIVGIISGNDTSAVGAISYYLMSSSQFGALKSYLLSDDNMVNMGIINSQHEQIIQDVSYKVLKTLYNPYQYIASCMWFPISSSDIVNKTSVTTIKIGWWPYSLSGYLLTAPTMIIDENDISLSSHPQAATRGNYLNYAPYTRRCLYGKFGSVPLDMAMFKTGDVLQIKYRVDLITGHCLAIFNRSRTLATDFITQKEFLLGVPIQIAQVGVDYLGTAATAISTGATAAQQAFSLNIGGAISTLANGIYDTIKTQQPQLETSGSNGSFLNSSNATKLVTMFYQIVDEDITHRGRPLCENRTIKNLSGFILCAEGDHDIPCMLEEKESITQYMTNGFFWE